MRTGDGAMRTGLAQEIGSGDRSLQSMSLDKVIRESPRRAEEQEETRVCKSRGDPESHWMWETLSALSRALSAGTLVQ